ncbi:HEPN domain-containing protein [Caulobacter sp.]|uniref:HEPN domain-containing protein n=1 Tax=Caulobacter sp. TaxID=78 RepID=UPI003BAA5BB2
MDGFERANSTFSSRIEDVVANLTLRRDHSFFVLYQGELFKREGMRADLKADLSRALSRKAPAEVLHRGLLLQLYGTFERLISDIAEATLEAAQMKAETYSALDEVIRNAHTVGSARLLTKMHDRAINGVSFDFIQLQRDLSACFSDATPYRLNGGAFTALLGVCTSDRLDTLFKSLRLGLAFEDGLVKHPSLKSWSKNASTRDALNRTKERLEDTVRLRNQIAHGATDPEVSDTEVEESASFLLALGQALLAKAEAGPRT